MTPSETSERNWVQLLCLLAVAHVFIFSAAFPVFTNVDEEAHFDLALKYSHGQPPRTMDKLSDETMDYYVVYCSQEYVQRPSHPGKLFPPPVWTASPGIAAPIIAARRALWNAPNHESAQPPLYYTAAGLWWHVGKWLGFHGGYRLYWLRFLNLFLVMALVWLGYGAARMIFPEEKFLRLGVPALLAFFPQPAFYSLQNDLLSAICFGGAFILLMKLARTEIPGIRLGIATGLALAAVFLTKASNLPLLALSALFMGLKIRQLARVGQLRASASAWWALVLCATLPMAAWLAWCKYNFGDFSGTAAKIHFLGWTYKPFAEWWTHPLFTPSGGWTYYSGLMATFWQGEMLWHRQPLASHTVGILYSLLSIALIGMAVVSLRSRAGMGAEGSRQALWFGFWGIIAVMVFLGFLSIIYDFHDCFYPSRQYPYFASGRLMLGALIPFALLYLYGLDRWLDRWNRRSWRWAALAGMVLFMLISELVTDRPVFASEYNWFHLQNIAAQSEAFRIMPHEGQNGN